MGGALAYVGGHYATCTQGVALIKSGERARGLRSLELAIEMGRRQKRGPLLLRDYESALAQARADAHREDTEAEVRVGGQARGSHL